MGLALISLRDFQMISLCGLGILSTHFRVDESSARHEGEACRSPASADAPRLTDR